MEELIDKLPKTPLYENFAKYLNTLKDEESEAILKYILGSSIIGNPLLEEFFMTEQRSVYQLLVHRQAYEVFKEDVDNWIAGLEPRFNDAGEVFFNGMQDFVGQGALILKQAGTQISHDLVQAQARLVTETDKVIQAGAVQLKAALDDHASELEKRLTATAVAEVNKLSDERKKVAKVLVDRFDETIEPHIKSFRSSTDEFTFKRIAYRVGEFFLAIAIYQGLKAVFF
ncbi:hypothetical protein [Variovorax sp. RA8]|uniref:hypothetical protein n=1 Tax=Variovorax sp. (strain JCM 16519 / RA8) TaxID=662548 RepID=UPI000AFBD161|nr:hypothetical protein [Variovorax sp. RA8]VTU34436.1 hypothetical protein RA8CHR_04973 [Variovorax sp. RA8]